jgi:PAS domain S-box-containing protein
MAESLDHVVQESNHQFAQRRNRYLNLIGLLLVVILPFVIVAYQLITEIDSRIQFSRYEIDGNAFLRPLEQLLYDLPYTYDEALYPEIIPFATGAVEETGRAERDRSGRTAVTPSLSATREDGDIGAIGRARLSQDRVDLIMASDRYGDSLGLTTAVNQLLHLEDQYQRSLSSAVDNQLTNNAIVRREISEYYRLLEQQTQSLVIQVGNASNLILDPDLDSYYLMSAVLLNLPSLQKTLIEQHYLIEAIAGTRPSGPNRERLHILNARLLDTLDTLQAGLATAFSHHADADLYENLSPLLQNLTTVLNHQTTQIQTLLDDHQTPPTAASRDEWSDVAIATLTAQFYDSLAASHQLWISTSHDLDALLHQRIQPFQYKTVLLKMFAVLMLLVLIVVGMFAITNLSELRQGTLWITTQYKTAQILADALELGTAAPAVLQTVGEMLGWRVGELWERQADDTLVRVALWHPDDISREPLQRDDWQRSFAIGEGLPGITCERKSAVWISDVTQDHQFLRQAIARELNLSSACGVPVVVDGTVTGALILFGDRSRRPNQDTLNVLQGIANQLGQFIKIRQSEVVLRRTEALQRLALSASGMGVWDWNITAGTEMWSPEVEQLFGLEPGTFSGSYEDFFNLLHPEDQPIVHQAQIDTFEHDAEYAPEYRVIWADGTVRWLTSRGRLYRDAAGQPSLLTGIVLDITDRKQAEIDLANSERRLRQAEEKYRSIYENAVVGIFQTTPNGYYLSANPALAQIYGYGSPQELMAQFTNIGQQLYVNPSRRHDFIQWVDQHDRISDFEAQVYRKDGSKIWISEQAIAVRDEQGQLLYYEGMVEDITERKLSQAALRDSEQRFRTLLNNIPGAFYRCACDQAWTMQFLSDAIADICGYPAEDFIDNAQREFSSMIHPEDVENVKQIVSAAIAEQQSFVLEYRMQHANGTVRWVYEKGQGIFDDQNNLRFLDGVIFDITERKQAEEFLAGQTDILEAIASGTELDQVLTLLIRTIQDRADRPITASILLLDEDGEHLRGGVAPDLPPAYSAQVDGIAIGPNQGSCGTAAYTQSPVVVSDIATDPKWVEYKDLALQFGLRACWSTPVLSSQGAVLGTFAFYLKRPASPQEQDWILIETAAHLAGIAIERQQTETELRRAKDVAEASSHAKSQFLANMSHELRTPLNAIIGYSEMLQEDAQDLGYDDLAPDLEKIRGAGKHLLALINDILDISKIEAGRMELHVESFSVDALLDDVRTTIYPLVEKNNNQFVIERAEALGHISADMMKLRQVLFNLLSNAAKFTEQGQVILRVERSPAPVTDSSTGLPTAEHYPGDWLCFQISDTGIGMTAEQIQRVFDAFSQADTSTTRKYGGTGLGLAISQRFCRMMGGDIAVNSQQGEGSTFTVWLPAVVTPDAAPIASSTVDLSREPTSQAQATLLVIDDDAVVGDLMRRSLHSQGFQIEVATDGTDGIKKARSLHPDVIILDVLLPNMNGWDVLAILKADPALADIPVILMTILDEQNRGFTLGASDYLTKPIDYKRLATLLQKYRPPEASDRTHVVLVVEDDADTRQMFQRILQKEGWQVITAENGRVGLEQYQASAPDLVLLDLMMPEMDGFQFLERLRQDEEGRSLPVIVVTAMDLSSRDRDRLNGSVEKILQKGAYDRDRLLAEVNQLVLNYLQ